MYCDTLQVQIQKSINRLLLRSLFKVVSAVALYFHLSILELVCEDDRCLTVIAFLLKKKKKICIVWKPPCRSQANRKFCHWECKQSVPLFVVLFYIFLVTWTSQTQSESAACVPWAIIESHIIFVTILSRRRFFAQGHLHTRCKAFVLVIVILEMGSPLIWPGKSLQPVGPWTRGTTHHSHKQPQYQ